MFKKIFFLILVSVHAFGQLENPAHWEFEYEPHSVKEGDEVTLHFKANIDKDWYLYSSDFDPKLGPVVTSFSFDKNKSYQLIGGIKPLHPKKKYDDIFEGDVTYFTKHGEFIQKVKILKTNPKISGSISYQTCTETDGKCVPGSKKFNFEIKTQEGGIGAVDSDNLQKKKEATGAVSETDSVVDQPKTVVNSRVAPDEGLGVPPVEPKNKPERGLLGFLAIAFGAGLASIFMPCIYPIMPMTVSYFTKQKKGKSKAIFYGLSIVSIFALMGLVTMGLGAPFLNFLATHWLPNLVFFILFILFGISLLGVFEIVLPHESVNKIDRLSEKGGYLGIFFMALTLVVVSFSCTVPFVGSLLIAASQGEVMRPLYGMLAFGLPFAIVFSGLAVFPSFLKELPRSGGWLNELKAVFGFLEFALALKFFSNIDLAYHFNILHRNIFLTLWIVLAVIIALYILGYIRLSKDERIEKRSLLRIGFAVLFFGLAIYMLPGVTNKPLRLLSGILPPLPVVATQGANKVLDLNQKALVHNLVGYKTLDAALAQAEKESKPVLIDFTGHACANCRKMEEEIWSQPDVLKSLQNEYIIASLYVDDKELLPKEQQYVSKHDNELKTTIGEKNIDLEIGRFNNNAQPFYVILDKKGNQIQPPIAYSSHADFVAFLERGLKLFHRK